MEKANIAFKEKIEALNIEAVNDGIMIKDLEFYVKFWKRSFIVLAVIAIPLLIHVVFSLTATS